MIKTWSTPVREESKKLVPCAACGAVFGASGTANCDANCAGVDSGFKSALDCGDFSYVRCRRCGLVQMNPQPGKTEVINRYGKNFGNDYLKYELENEAAFLKLQQLALKDARFFKFEKTLFPAGKNPQGGVPREVLDIGCATGALLSFLRERLWRVTGVEISPCGEYAKNERGLDVRNLPLEENNFESAAFDAVLASHVIEHLNDPRSFLAEIHRVLKDNGRVFITTPNISGFQARLTGSRWRSAIFDHLYLFSARTLGKMLKNAGFKIEEIRTWGGLACGLAPLWLKKPADFLAKRLNFGDVMIIRARKK